MIYLGNFGGRKEEGKMMIGWKDFWKGKKSKWTFF
jgi:hypothetical protein